ncbi:lipopolysaccharide-induced tumor necrosis factor-alpha factor homolog isoform X1 [Mytilus edulis]|uniref:lipopolysaccharide-induced tumor necrosis factor-alpha factor homolog isoform X1 n=1 Tax=Mytilus edulis TaxID=6550 RepID=UPI0039EFC30A
MEKQGNLPPPPQYSQGGQQSTVVITSPAMLGPQFREVPVRTQCPACQADIMTSTRYETGTLTWISIGALCLFGCWLGCCLIPLCVDPCKDVVHSCPNCKQMVGKYNRM